MPREATSVATEQRHLAFAEAARSAFTGALGELAREAFGVESVAHEGLHDFLDLDAGTHEDHAALGHQEVHQGGETFVAAGRSHHDVAP